MLLVRDDKEVFNVNLHASAAFGEGGMKEWTQKHIFRRMRTNSNSSAAVRVEGTRAGVA